MLINARIYIICMCESIRNLSPMNRNGITIRLGKQKELQFMVSNANPPFSTEL